MNMLLSAIKKGMSKKVGLFSAILIGLVGLSASAETIRIPMNGNFSGGDKIMIKSEMIKQGHRPQQFRLNSVRVVGEGVAGAVLSMSRNDIDANRIVLNFNAPKGKRYQSGAWQIHFKGMQTSLSVRRLVLDVSRRNSRPSNRPRTKAFNSPRCSGHPCSCVTPGRLGVPYKHSADKFCKINKFSSASKFSTAKGPRNSIQCIPGGKCFNNRHRGNLICASITCKR